MEQFKTQYCLNSTYNLSPIRSYKVNKIIYVLCLTVSSSLSILEVVYVIEVLIWIFWWFLTNFEK